MSSTTRLLLRPAGALVAVEGVLVAAAASSAEGSQLTLVQEAAAAITEAEAVVPVRTRGTKINILYNITLYVNLTYMCMCF
jgi:hypothetical protein